MFASIASFLPCPRARERQEGVAERTLPWLAAFRRSEQGRHLADRKRSEKNRAFHKAHGKRHGRLAFENCALAECRDEPGPGTLACEPAEPWDQPVERA